MSYLDTAFQQHLRSLGACGKARKWAGSRTAAETWEQCERADWLLWWVTKTEANTRQQIVLAACVCARRALRFVPAGFVPVGEDRLRLAIEEAERWAAEQTGENRQAAVDAAVAAAEHKEMCTLVRSMLAQPWEEVGKYTSASAHRGRRRSYHVADSEGGKQ